MQGLLVVVLIVLIVSWVATQARTARAKKVGNSWTFSPVPVLQWVFVVGIALGVFLIILGITGPKSDQRLVLVMTAFFLALLAAAWPKSICVSEDGISQRNWYGRRRCLRWPDITDVRMKNDGSVLVRGKHTKVVFSSSHSGRDRFIQQLAQKGWPCTFHKGA